MTDLGSDAVVEIKPGQVSAEALIDAIDDTLRSGPAGLRVWVPLAAGDKRFAALQAVCAADHRVSLGTDNELESANPIRISVRRFRRRRAVPPPPEGTLAHERAEHLRHRARGATMRARVDRGQNRVSRERLQVRHERARLRAAEERLGHTGPNEWVRWRLRTVGRLVGAIPGRLVAIANKVRSYAKRIRRYAADRLRR